LVRLEEARNVKTVSGFSAEDLRPIHPCGSGGEMLNGTGEEASAVLAQARARAAETFKSESGRIMLYAYTHTATEVKDFQTYNLLSHVRQKVVPVSSWP
jgi:hypothetical protein